MVNHILEKRRLDRPHEMPINEFCAMVKELAKGLVDPVVGVDYWWDETEWYVEGWRPMTEQELAAAEKRRAAAKRASEARKAKKEAAERAKYEKLKAKYGE